MKSERFTNARALLAPSLSRAHSLPPPFALFLCLFTCTCLSLCLGQNAKFQTRSFRPGLSATEGRSAPPPHPPSEPPRASCQRISGEHTKDSSFHAHPRARCSRVAVLSPIPVALPPPCKCYGHVDPLSPSLRECVCARQSTKWVKRRQNGRRSTGWRAWQEWYGGERWRGFRV